MFRRVMLAIVLCMTIIPVANAKKEKTITYKDGVLTDTTFHYTMRVSENWKVKAFNEPGFQRAFLEKKNYSINREVQSYGGDYTIPTIVIFAQEFNGTAGDFEALLKKSLDEHSSDNQVIRKLGLLIDSDFVTSGDVTIDSVTACQIILKRNYKRVLSKDAYTQSSSPADVPEKLINDHEVHELYLVKKGSILYVIQAFSEREFFQENKAEFDPLILSLRFVR